MTTEIDVSNKVEFIASDDDDFTFYIKCVCGGIYPYPNTTYNDKTRLLWDCPGCGARLYFKDAHDYGNAVIQVIDG